MLKRIVINFAVITVVVATASIVIGVGYYQAELARHNLEQVNLLKKARLITEKEFYEIIADTQVLAGLPVVKNFLTDRSKNNQRLVQNTFIQFASAYGRYDQLRLIDLHGQELVRINYRNKQAQVVADKQLQNKADRYYFKRVALIKPEQVYISPVDLNVEAGLLERPLQPMIRFSKPVTDARNEISGYLVVNYQADNLFDSFKHIFDTLNDCACMLVNQAGYWLLSPVPSDAWSWMLGKPEISFKTRYPQAWRQIQVMQQGSYHSDAGIYDWLSFYPFERSEVVMPYGNKPTDSDMIVADDYLLHLILLTPENRWQQHFWWTKPSGQVIIVSVVLLCLLLSVLLARFQLFRYQLKSATQARSAMYQDLYQYAPFGYGTITGEGTITDINQTLLDWLGYKFDELYHHSLFELIAPDSLSEAKQCAETLAKLNGPMAKELTLTRKHGDKFRAYISASPQLSNNGDMKLIRLAVQDINDKYQLERQLLDLANTDPLTGVLNRRAWFEQSRHEWARSIRHNTPLSVMMLDLDHFKSINDNYGHEFGDLVLKTFVQICQQHIRETDLFARFGGEEFCVLLPDTELPTAVEVGKRLKQEIAEQKIAVSDDTMVSFSVSIGVSCRQQQTHDLEALLRQADHYLYQAKHRGRNQIKAELET